MTNLTNEELASALRGIATWGGHGPTTTEMLMEAANRLVAVPASGPACERSDFIDGCSGPVSTREDKYAREINDRPGQMVTLCEYHHQDLLDAI